MSAHPYPAQRHFHRGVFHRRTATDRLLPVAIAFLALGAMLVGWTLARW